MFCVFLPDASSIPDLTGKGLTSSVAVSNLASSFREDEGECCGVSLGDSFTASRSEIFQNCSIKLDESYVTDRIYILECLLSSNLLSSIESHLCIILICLAHV